MTNLAEFQKKVLPQVEACMLDFIATYTTDDTLKDSMGYSIKAGGKRLRPLLLLATLASFDKELHPGAIQTAAALEMIHTYSLIHDDLPAMDDDDLRRGQATNHKVYGEGLAILAGDGLLTEAFHLLASAQLPPEEAVLLLQQLAQAAGSFGMVAGQAADVQGENQALTLSQLAFIHQRKTGALIRFALIAGGVLAKQPEPVIEQLAQLAEHLGLAFQIRDDLLDVTATKEELGKNVGHDQELAKSTYPQLMGLAGAKGALTSELDHAEAIITALQADPQFHPELFTELLAWFKLA